MNLEEAQLLHDVRKEFGRLKNGRLLRFSTGVLKSDDEDREDRYVSFGVPGFPDLAGILGSPEICPGCGIVVRPERGHWIGLELKSSTGRTQENQKKFHRMIEQYGGSVAVVKTLDEARAAMRAFGARW